MSSNQFGGPGLALTNLETISKATVQALNNLNQTLTTLNTTTSQLQSINSALETLNTVLNGVPGAPQGAVVIVGSASEAAANAVATLPAATGVTNYITGFDITSSGSTSAAVVNVTVTGIATTLNYSYATVAGATSPNAPLSIRFSPAIPASPTNGAISVTLPSLGTGNTNATVSVYGSQI